jgi:hypothetical protein
MINEQPVEVLRTPAPWGLAHVLAVRPWQQVVFLVASHTIFLSSFFRFDVLV